jgi:TonB family protein
MIVTAALAFGEDTKAIEKKLNDQLKNGMVVLRTPRVGTKLRFDIDGRSTDPEGIRGFDEKLKVIKAKLGKDELVLKCLRLHDAYSPSENSIKIIDIPEQVEIHLALADVASEQAIAETNRKVFKSSAELAERKCSDYEYVRKYFKDTQREAQSQEACFPSGARGWTSTAFTPGITPAKAIHDPEPSYPADETSPTSQGSADLLLRIDESGRVTDGIVLRSSQANFARQSSKVINEWRFKPAERDGKPIASILVVEFSFHRYQ